MSSDKTRKMHPILGVGQLIERAFLLLAAHPYVKNPIVAPHGAPVPVVRFRNYDRDIEEEDGGVTISIYPYYYDGPSNETVNSKNVSLWYEDYHPGSGPSGFDRAKLNLIVKIATFGFALNESPPDPANYLPIVERNMHEYTLYEWLPVLRGILLTKPLQDLGGLVKNSTVNWGTFHTPKWLNRGGRDAVMHSATLMWTLELNAPRNWREYPRHNDDLPNTSETRTWHFVGVRRRDGTAIYWDSNSSQLVTIEGFALPFTPKGQRVRWDLLEERFEHLDGTPMTATELEDPSTSPIGPWIDVELRLVGVLMPSRTNLYWNRTAMALQKADGTAVTHLEDGITPIAYDTVRKVVTYANTGDPADPSTQTPIDVSKYFIPLNASSVNVYEAATLQLRDRFTF